MLLTGMPTMVKGYWSTCTRYVVLPALIVSGAISSASAGETTTYFHNDILGSPVVATDTNGLVAWKEHYRPYGDRIVDQPESTNNALWYTGKPHDEGTGLTYMGARYYDPAAGRFTGLDPAPVDLRNIHSFNRYGYGSNSPYVYIDPDGREVVYAYRNGATNSDRAETMSYLARSATARAEISRVEQSSETYTITFDRAAERMSYDPDSRTVTINPTLGLRIKSSGDVQSAAIGGGHEISHAAQHDRLGTEAYKESDTEPFIGSEESNGVVDFIYGTAPEEHRATQVETQIAEELGDATRQNYSDERGVVKTCGPTSREQC